ncbi:thermonuclease family protein [Microvirga sp. VF16]|uniref:thermonuclease family protein n=1 Tax=Microvirga sp. VF16 TaxID=2807101 RepID=UPI00193D3C5B|nr:thermonuclease family protein [Microvirga sp. VF16]QRM35451.1 thermonuclease family protein [Microvirga sp. VF16]
MMRYAGFWLALLVFVTNAAISGYAKGNVVIGYAHVLDGDTADIDGKRVRFFGIDAPELSQSCVDAAGRSWQCGQEARGRLMELTQGKVVTCTYEEADATGRLLGSCKVAGRDINGILVAEGLAWAFVRYSDVYLVTERQARAERKGIFAAKNVTAWDYRAERWHKSTAETQTGASKGCPIKGNVSASGEHIYHMPWDRYYAATKIDTTKGERWFCDEADAEKAGWRRAYR